MVEVVEVEVTEITCYTLSYCGAMRQTLKPGAWSLEPGACDTEQRTERSDSQGGREQGAVSGDCTLLSGWANRRLVILPAPLSTVDWTECCCTTLLSPLSGQPGCPGWLCCTTTHQSAVEDKDLEMLPHHYHTSSNT